MLRWAVLGTGFISNTVIEAIELSNDSTVTVIGGRTPSKLEDFQRRHGIPAARSLDEAVYSPDVDVVYIGLPNHQHHPYAIAAAEAGKPVLSEKSLTTTVDSAQELLAAVRNHQTFFVEGLMYLAHPVARTFVALLEDGRLGSLRSISARYGANIAHLVNPEGRGTIYNLGCYPVSLAHLAVQTMLGPDAWTRRTLAASGIANPTDGTICDAALALRFESDVLATIQSSDRYGNTSDFSVAGDTGTLRFVTNPWLPLAGTNLIEWQPHDGKPEHIAVETAHDAFYHQVKMVESHVAAGDTEARRPSPRWSDSFEILELLTEWEAACLAQQ